MMCSHRSASLQFRRMSTLVEKATSVYREKIDSLPEVFQFMGGFPPEERFLKEKYWKFGIFMAAATSLPLLHTASDTRIMEVVCAKASVATSAKVLDNLNDEAQPYQEALQSLEEYKSALKKGVYKPDGVNIPAERCAHEMATWVYATISSYGSTKSYSSDVDLLVSGQIASLQHKIRKYPSMKEYLSHICERSIGNVWIDVDFAFLGNGEPYLKKGNDYIFKSYLVYDDVQDIFDDLRTNSVNSAMILGIERGLFSEEDIGYKNEEILYRLEESEVFQDLLCLGDLVFQKGLEIVSECETIDSRGLAASLGMIRMFNIRNVLGREKNLDILNTFLANHKMLEKVKERAPEHILDMAEHVL